LPSERRKSNEGKPKPSVDKEFLELGRRHFRESFPNPSRQGCPQDEVLRLLAQKPTFVADEIQRHITSCSPCYRTYSQFLRKMKATFSNRPSPSDLRKRSRK
jgi:hypothetical protein